MSVVDRATEEERASEVGERAVKGEQARPAVADDAEDEEEEKEEETEEKEVGPAKPSRASQTRYLLAPCHPGRAGPWSIYPSPGRALALVGPRAAKGPQRGISRVV
ncbi:uncharacterized protein ARB_02696 [Trichophyton benhamiae CBS 112371]|uniref:Uncharacterized protein n=1 Tax=Arthroderma benhamiae (strain ATCC MYA-4681 / CBS 112371) TaxID=663331 RepID=D4B2G8_ARTBC|nr:uncharacterized protein ARB_02696 [Trichophyton benhamiae CBS 112371]EFE30534.1 hypothetical protein ARB_02696 [Trichophyton benhamiae CBS 112371]